MFGSVGVHQSADDTDADHEKGLVPVYVLVWRRFHREDSVKRGASREV